MITLAERAARSAGAILRERKKFVVRHKGAVDLVTEVDLASETLIREFFAKETPSIPVLAEEGGGAEKATTRWVVDPLDGTTNFVHDFPSYCVSIALQDQDKIQVAAIYDPIRDRCFLAEAGRGATVNGAPIQVSNTQTLDQALVASGFAYDRRERPDFYLKYVRAFLLNAQGFRRAGAAAMDMAMLASGSLDGFWEFNLSPWDVAAGSLIVEEAGGRVTDMDLSPLKINSPRVLATNARIHDEMASVILPLLRSDS